jgi:hypothetical protein
MIKYFKKLIKKQKLLKKYNKSFEDYKNHLWLIRNFKWDKKEKHWLRHNFLCEIRCYNRLKKL